MIVRLRAPLSACVICFAFAACAGPSDPGQPGPSPPDDLSLSRVVGGLERPVHLAAPPGDDRLFIVEQRGRIRIFEDGVLRTEPFLDLSADVSGGSEQGLLGLAFHPAYASNGRFFVNYTDLEGNTRIVRYTVGPDPSRADPASAAELMFVAQPFANHNGGHLVFGPDGMLYATLGDGGGGGDPAANAQDPATLLGSVLRLDVDGDAGYAIPPDNPFANHPTNRPEIWLFGVRNPWRIGFDDDGDGSLYVADVGQSAREEVTVLGPDDGGANLGWNVLEGSLCFGGGQCSTDGFRLPQVEYDHDEGCSITGGDVYRGSIEELRGTYFYSDFCSGWLRSFRFRGGAVVEEMEWAVQNPGRVFSFGEDGSGEMYILADEAVYRLARDETPP